MDYRITTDSNSDLRPEFIAEHNIPIIPQYYSFGEEVFGDEKNMSPKEFYETMRKGELPKSMANNPAVIHEKFETILKEGKDILHIAFSSALSGSCNNVMVEARQLMDKYPERKILVFDSLNASLGEGVSVYRAVELQKEGKSLEQAYKLLMAEREHVNVWFTVDNLHHLQRGGRISKTTAIVGSVINIKPLLCVTKEGQLQSSGTVRGRKKALKALVSNMEQALELDNYGKDRIVGIVHGDCMEDAIYVKELVNQLGFKKVIINDVSPSIGTHAGPGVVGLIFYGKEVK